MQEIFLNYKLTNLATYLFDQSTQKLGKNDKLSLASMLDRMFVNEIQYLAPDKCSLRA